jgi:two-component system, sensor histidine kinase PdtaS
MLLILSLGLFPLGFVAMLASLETARENSHQRQEETRTRLEISAQRVNTALSRSAITIRAASAAISLTPVGSDVCETTLQRLSRGSAYPGRYALYADGNELRCATPGYVPPPNVAGQPGRRSLVELTEDRQSLRFVLYDEDGDLEGTGEFPREVLAGLATTPHTISDFDLELVENGRSMLLHDGFQEAALMRTVLLSAPVADGRLELRIAAGEVPITVTEMLMILLPMLMWLAAALIGWIIVDKLLLRPLARMQKVVSAYQPGDRHLDLPTMRTPAREIGELGQAFDQVTKTVARHEAELEAAVERQTRLVREVHHRVKNNLQVVASLLNLHARGATNEDVAAAYASIQRRVDALAVVHRNHFAELEENRGVALKPLISELSANLKATAPASAANIVLRLNLESFHATQDVAVSVAFLVTEVIEFAMLCGATSVSVSLQGKGGPTARLTLESESLGENPNCDPNLFERFDRIVTGLSRQLRSTLVRDLESGRYGLDIAVVEKADR